MQAAASSLVAAVARLRVAPQLVLARHGRQLSPWNRQLSSPSFLHDDEKAGTVDNTAAAQGSERAPNRWTEYCKLNWDKQKSFEENIEALKYSYQSLDAKEKDSLVSPKPRTRKPKSAYALFLKERWDKSKTLGENSKALSIQWKAMEESGREYYKTRFSAENATS